MMHTTQTNVAKGFPTKAAAIILSLVLAFALMPFIPMNTSEAEAVELGAADAFAAGANLTGTQLYFGEYASNPILWYVVYDAESGKVTLWTTTSMGDRAYDTGGGHNLWSNSTLCAWLNNSSDGFLADFTQAEQDAIVGEYSTTQESGYNTGDTFTPNQRIVLPSVAEMGDGYGTGTWDIDSIKRSFDYWWLRSPGYYVGDAAFVDSDGFVSAHGAYTGSPLAVRPAFKLNLESVFFTSSATATEGKSPVGVSTAALTGVDPIAPGDPIKLTVKDRSQDLKLIATTEQATQTASAANAEYLTFSYDNATPGTDQYVSCIWTDKQSGALKYYGKLADSSSAASGSLYIPLDGVDAGTYTVSVFSEQANADTSTDFASEPVTMTVKVEARGDWPATVSDFNGRVLSYNADLTSIAGQAVSPTGTGTQANPKTVSIDVANSQSSLALADIVAADANATVALYSDASFTQSANPLALVEGGATRAYILVTAEDGTLCYYGITINRAAAPVPTKADAAKNAFTVESGFTQTVATDFTITATGDRQGAAGTTTGDTRFIPTQASANPTVSFTDMAPYTATMSIAHAGSYKLSVTYAEQEWNGNTWVATGTTDTKSEQIKVVDPTDSKSLPGDNGTKNLAATGDSASYVLAAVLLLALSTAALIAIRRKRSRDSK